MIKKVKVLQSTQIFDNWALVNDNQLEGCKVESLYLFTFMLGYLHDFNALNL